MTKSENQAPAERKDDPVAEMILTMLHGLGTDRSVSPMDVARAFADSRARPKDPPEVWRRYMTAVKQQMVHLAREGRIEIIRKGQKVDPDDFKGVVRLRLPQQD